MIIGDFHEISRASEKRVGLQLTLIAVSFSKS